MDTRQFERLVQAIVANLPQDLGSDKVEELISNPETLREALHHSLHVGIRYSLSDEQFEELLRRNRESKDERRACSVTRES